MKWIREVGIQKFWTGKYPFMEENCSIKELDQKIDTIFRLMKDVQQPTHSYSDDPYNIPLQEQFEKEI